MGDKRNLKYKSITRNWGGKEIQFKFDAIIDEWISQFEEEEQEVLLKLLKNFHYYTNRKLKYCVCNLFSKLTALKDFSIDMACVFIPTYKEFGVGFSNIFFSDFWLCNDLYDYSEGNIYSLLENGECFDTIVIVDDYSGTGKTVKKTIEKCIKSNENCRESAFFVLTAEISKKAIENIRKYVKEEGITLDIVSLRVTEKAFKKGYVFDEYNTITAQNKFQTISLNHKVGNDFILGYGKTQALISFEYNTPNNTLGLFWHEDDNFIAMFKRHKKKSTYLADMQKDVEKRKKQRELDIIYKHDIEEKYIFLLIYLLRKDMKFSYAEAGQEFGMTNEQLDEALNYLLQNKYVGIKQGRFCQTELSKKYIKVTKIKEIDKVTKDDWTIDEKRKGSLEDRYIPKEFDKVFDGYKEGK